MKKLTIEKLGELVERLVAEEIADTLELIMMCYGDATRFPDTLVDQDERLKKWVPLLLQIGLLKEEKFFYKLTIQAYTYFQDLAADGYYDRR